MMCRELRVANRLKQREVANGIGVKTSTYGNVESASHKTIRLERVHGLARFYQLDEATTADLVAAWEELPASEYSQRQAKSYEARKAFRGKARNHDRMKVSLLEMTTLFVTSVNDPGALCACEPPDPASLFDGAEADACELCSALHLLGLSGGWTEREEVIEKLAAIQEAM